MFQAAQSLNELLVIDGSTLVHIDVLKRMVESWRPLKRRGAHSALVEAMAHLVQKHDELPI